MMVDTYVGKIRAFVHKTDDDNSYETFKITTFDDQLISDVEEITDREWLKIEIDQIGLDGVDDQTDHGVLKGVRVVRARHLPIRSIELQTQILG